MRTVLAPLIGPYVMGAKLLSDRVVQFVHNAAKTPRGKWIAFGLIVVVLSFAAVAGTDYLNSIVYARARCPLGYYCDPATARIVMRYASAISTLVYWNSVFLSTSVMLRIALSFKLVDSLASSKVNRLLASHSPSGTGIVTYQTEPRLYRICWFFIGLSFACSITVMILSQLVP